MKSKKRHKIQNTTSQIYWPHCELCTVWSTIMAVSDHSHYMQPYRAFVGLFLILAKKSHLSICYSRLEEEMSDYTFCSSKLILMSSLFKNSKLFNCLCQDKNTHSHTCMQKSILFSTWMMGKFILCDSILPDCQLNKQSQESFDIRMKSSLWTACVYIFKEKNNYFHDRSFVHEVFFRESGGTFHSKDLNFWGQNPSPFNLW